MAVGQQGGGNCFCKSAQPDGVLGQDIGGTLLLAGAGIIMKRHDVDQDGSILPPGPIEQPAGIQSG